MIVCNWTYELLVIVEVFIITCDTKSSTIIIIIDCVYIYIYIWLSGSLKGEWLDTS